MKWRCVFPEVLEPVALFAICAMLAVGTCAGQSPSASDTRLIATSLTGFSIPFKIDDPSGSYIEVQLYLSRDRGKSWTFHERQHASERDFAFRSDGDGEYWFALKTLDRNRQLLPPGNVVRPELRVVVDTVKPTLDFRVESDAAGRIVAAWSVKDLNIDPKSLKLMFREADGNAGDDQWIPVEFQLPGLNILRDVWSDQIAWWPKTDSHELEVKLEIADSAGNSASEVHRVARRHLAPPRQQSNSTTTQRNPFYPNANNALFANRNSKRPKQNTLCQDGSCSPVFSGAQPLPQPKRQFSNAHALQNNQQFMAGQKFPVGSERELVDPPAPEPAAVAPRNDAPADIAWESKINQWIGRSQTRNGSTSAGNDIPADIPKPAELRQPFHNVPVVNGSPPNINQVVPGNSVSQQGDMNISQSTAIGHGIPQQPLDSVAAGPLRPQLTGSQNPGQSEDDNPRFPAGHEPTYPSNAKPPVGHQRFAPVSHSLQNPTVANHDPTPQLNVNTRRFNLNYDIRAIDPSGVGEVILWATENAGQSWRSWATDPDNLSPFPVEVQSEGIFGFKVVINSRDGLTGKPPVSGEQPDVWVQVDLTIPEVAITSAPYGSGRDAGKLIINFSASDQFLTLRPIKLAYSPETSGPWTTIETALRNTGSYAWKVPGQVPEQIHLRAEARDTSGNVGVWQTTAPIDISGLVPRGRIYSVDPIR